MADKVLAMLISSNSFEVVLIRELEVLGILMGGVAKCMSKMILSPMSGVLFQK